MSYIQPKFKDKWNGKKITSKIKDGPEFEKKVDIIIIIQCNIWLCHFALHGHFLDRCQYTIFIARKKGEFSK
jgi:hypothetical protein